MLLLTGQAITFAPLPRTTARDSLFAARLTAVIMQVMLAAWVLVDVLQNLHSVIWTAIGKKSIGGQSALGGRAVGTLPISPHIREVALV